MRGRLFIPLPVFKFQLSFTLYRFIGLRRTAANHSMVVRYMELPDYLAVATDRQTFIEMTAEETSHCRQDMTISCPINRAIKKKDVRKAWVAAIFLEVDKRVSEERTTTTNLWTGQVACLPRPPRRWEFSTTSASSLMVNCPYQDGRPTSHLMNIPTVGAIEVPMRCSAQSDGWLFQASF